jgi:hypothetical protein
MTTPISIHSRVPDETRNPAPDPHPRTLPALERTPAVLQDELQFSVPMRSPDTVRFRLSEAGPVRLELSALSGRLGMILLDASLRAGWHAAALPESVPPGTYFVRMRTMAGRTTAMMVVTR